MGKTDRRQEEVTMQSIRVEKVTVPKEKPDSGKLGFGKYFTDHMFVMEYSEGQGWHDARIIPFGNLSLSPASTVFHYGAEIFEGLKAYRTPDGGVQLFRPSENFARMNNSAERICLPQLDADFALSALIQFVDMERDWVPSRAPRFICARSSSETTRVSAFIPYITRCMSSSLLRSAAIIRRGLTPSKS